MADENASNAKASKANTTENAQLLRQFRDFFTTRHFILHNGRDLRRFSIGARAQALMAGVASLTLLFSGYDVSQAMAEAITTSGVSARPATPEAQLRALRAEVARMQSEVAEAKQAVRDHAQRVEQRQALLAAVIDGKAKGGALDKLAGAVEPAAPARGKLAQELVAPLRAVEAHQVTLAGKARAAGEARIARTTVTLHRLGLSPARFANVQGGMGGPYEPISDSAGTNGATTGTTEVAARADEEFRTLFLTWKKLDALEQTVISVPSMQPVEKLVFTSHFGVRSDPFRGTAAMHAGVDIPGSIGTPIYATADGVVSHAGRQGGYGNLVQINHGRGIETRYGHLSKILVADNTRVRRGQIIGLMGSTGRSTGSHLHYEVRVDGRAVNPIPFLQTGEYVASAQQVQGGVGGPRP